MAQTYYEVLGVPEDATSAEIDAAFKSKAREVHPDRVAPGNPYLRKVAAEAFKDLSEAKTVLLDATERQKYDAELAYLRGSQANYSPPSPPPPPPPSPAPQRPASTAGATRPQTQATGQSFWKPVDTTFGRFALVTGLLGCMLLMIGFAGGEKFWLIGLTMICLALGLLCWRHGSRPTTDAAFTGGSIILLVTTVMLWTAWLGAMHSVPSATTASTAGQRSIGGRLPNQATPAPSPVVRGSGSGVPKPERRSSGSGTKHSAESDPSLGAIRGSSAGTAGASSGKTQDASPAERSLDITPDLVRTSRREDARPARSLGGEQLSSSGLSPSEQQSIEAACSNDKYLNGPAAYKRCLDRQLSLLGGTSRQPDLSALSGSERQSIEAACSTDKYLNGPAAYDRCLEKQLSQLGGTSRQPDLSALSGSERQSIEAACSTDKYLNGPAAYNRCLEKQLRLLGGVSRLPDLSRLSNSERQSIEAACSSDKYLNGPAAYDRCLQKQLDVLKNNR